jgi:predicted carbohydrate-binding protein with CBM5 and CBM33 domain
VQARRRIALAGALVATAPILSVFGPVSPAGAHGTLSDPPSRIWQCAKNENPENPTSEGCKAAKELGGSAVFYDTNEVSLLDAGGQHQAKIPDGKLCSAGREKFRGLDVQTTGWPAKSVKAGPLTVNYAASAPHAKSQFTFFITKSGYSPTGPLKWSDLEQIADFKNQDPTANTKWTLNLPQRSGRHILYSIWQRSVGSAEAFYTCSDVDFGGGVVDPTKPPTTPPTSKPPVIVDPTTPPTSKPPVVVDPTTPPTTPPPATGGSWAPNTAYKAGDKVTYGGKSYLVRQAHTSLLGWEPPNVPALWTAI